MQHQSTPPLHSAMLVVAVVGIIGALLAPTLTWQSLSIPEAGVTGATNGTDMTMMTWWHAAATFMAFVGGTVAITRRSLVAAIIGALAIVAMWSAWLGVITVEASRMLTAAHKLEIGLPFSYQAVHIELGHRIARLTGLVGMFVAGGGLVSSLTAKLFGAMQDDTLVSVMKNRLVAGLRVVINAPEQQA